MLYVVVYMYSYVTNVEWLEAAPLLDLRLRKTRNRITKTRNRITKTRNRITKN